MQMRPLGRSGISIAPLILGGNVFGWTADEKTSHSILDAFVEAGFNAIDTADVYATWIGKGGLSEETLGRWLKASGKRDRVVVCTKVGAPMAEDKKGLSAAYINAAVEDSLRRLQTDYIDLYQSHRDDPETPQEETMAAFAALVKAGKVRAIGSSNFTPERLASANAIAAAGGGPRYETEQPLYNLMERQVVEPGLADLAVKEQVGLIPYFGLAAGFLTGKYRSEADLAKSPRGGGVKKYVNERGLAVLAALDAVAGRHRATPAQVALAWQMAKPFIAAPIASATSVAQLREIMPAVNLGLTPVDVAELDAASARVALS
jgi:aryl-alcohol dehydrogenase-like predicted oxidoreductase